MGAIAEQQASASLRSVGYRRMTVKRSGDDEGRLIGVAPVHGYGHSLSLSQILAARPYHGNMTK
jgi:hypothetical protein